MLHCLSLHMKKKVTYTIKTVPIVDVHAPNGEIDGNLTSKSCRKKKYAANVLQKWVCNGKLPLRIPALNKGLTRKYARSLPVL